MYFEDVSQSVMRELARIHRGITCAGAACKGGGTRRGLSSFCIRENWSGILTLKRNLLFCFYCAK